MSSKVVIEKVQVVTDERGLVVEPVPEKLMAAQRNLHVVLTEPGCIRGNHYHPRGTEISVIVGPALVRVREGTDIRDVHVPEGQAFRFTFPPGTAHAVQNEGTRPLLLIAFNSLPHDPIQPDVVREVLIESARPL